MKKTVSIVVFAAMFGVRAFAQIEQDAEGCKDHPMFSRMPGFFINQCAENYASLDVIVGSENKIQAEEGNRTHIDYLFNPTNRKPPSWLQVAKNYENAII